MRSVDRAGARNCIDIDVVTPRSDRSAVHHVAERDVGGIPRHPQPHLVAVEDFGDDAELGGER